MAETNLTSSATNSDCNALSLSVPSDADQARAGLSRRNAMQLITSVAAIPTIALAGSTAAFGKTPDRNEWERVRANFKSAEAEYDRISKKTRAIDRAYLQFVGSFDRAYFGKYQLSEYPDLDQTTDERYRTVHMALCIERAKDAVNGRSTESQIKAISDDARRIVQEYEEFLSRRTQANEKFDLDHWEEVFDAAVDRRHEAQEAFFAAPAPDHTAMLEKVELLTAMMTEADVDDAERMELIRSDARRLLASLN